MFIRRFPLLAAAPLASTSILEAVRRLQRFAPLLGPIVDIPFPEPERNHAPVTVRVCALVARGSTATLERFQRDLDQARAVWGRCGIILQQGGFTQVRGESAYPNWVNTATAPEDLLRQRGNCGPNEIRLYYVRSIANTLTEGRSGFTFNEPGYVAVSDEAHINLFPHELGHLFLGGNEEHRDGPSMADQVNVMRSNVGTIIGIPQVDPGQCTRAQAAVRSARFTGGGQGGSGPAQGMAMATQMQMIAALQDPRPMVRLAALRALAALRSPIAQPMTGG